MLDHHFGGPGALLDIRYGKREPYLVKVEIEFNSFLDHFSVIFVVLYD